MISTFALNLPASGCKCWNWTTSSRAASILALIVLAVIIPGRDANAAETESPDSREAKVAFGSVKSAAGQISEAIGPYDKGCVSGARPLPITGGAWQVMRPSRNRVWGHPALIAYLQKLARDLKSRDGSAGLLVGDMAQPIGGPLLGGHASHQTGLDADLWYTPMPSRVLSAGEREEISAISMVDRKTLAASSAWTETQVKLLRRAASYPEVVRIFVHPAVKKALCDSSGTDRAWLEKIRPWFQHDDHFHVRLGCPPGSPKCVAQAPVSGDDGCGKELDDWFKKLRVPAKRPKGPPLPPKPVLVSDLPKECQALLAEAESQGKSAAASNGK